MSTFTTKSVREPARIEKLLPGADVGRAPPHERKQAAVNEKRGITNEKGANHGIESRITVTSSSWRLV